MDVVLNGIQIERPKVSVCLYMMRSVGVETHSRLILKQVGGGGHFDHWHYIPIARADDTAMIIYISVCTRLYVCLMWPLYIYVLVWPSAPTGCLF